MFMNGEKMKYNKNFTLCSHNTDFEPRIRNDVIDYIVKRFGSEYVSAIGTYGITRTKVAIQDTARVFGIPPSETFALTKNFMGDIDDDMTLDQLEEQIPELKKYLDKWEAKGYKLRYFINGIRNAHRQISQHAAGVLVSSDKLIDNVALVQSRKRIVTSWQEGSDYHELSDLGYYKYDILGLNNLQVVNDAHSLIKKRRGIDIDWDSVDLDDEFVYENVVKNHDHFGVFQYECLDKDVVVEGKTVEEWYNEGKPDYLTSYDEENKEFIKNECLKVVKSGKKQIYEVELENGKTIRSSADHKFLTKKGWKALKDLTEEDHILTHDT